MIGLLNPEKVARLPIVKSWLHNGDAALSIVRKRNTAAAEGVALKELIEENVLQQLHHLGTHPSVAGRLAENMLTLSGWVYDIGHGTVRTYNEKQRKFLPVSIERPMTSGAPSK